MSNIPKGKATILTNFVMVTQEIWLKWSAQCVPLPRRTVLPLLLPAHQNEVQTHTGRFLRMDKLRVSNPSQPVLLPRKSPMHLLFLLQYQLWEVFLLSWEQQTENSCMKHSVYDSINRPWLGTEDVIIKTPGSGESLSKLWNAREKKK